MRTCELGRLTWKEAEEVYGENPMILIPIGAMEPHGLQLPLGTDYIVAQYVAKEAAQKCKNVLVAPTIPYGYCDSVKKVPGAMNIYPDTMKALLSDIIRNLHEHGTNKVIFVNNHRTNSLVIEWVARELRRELGMEFATFFPWGVIQSFSPSMYEDFAKVFGHGAEPETSVMHATWPEDVRMDLAVADQYGTKWGCPAKGPSTIEYQGIPIEVYLESSEITSTCTRGDPFAYDDARGKKMMDGVIDRLVKFINFFSEVGN